MEPEYDIGPIVMCGIIAFSFAAANVTTWILGRRK